MNARTRRETCERSTVAELSDPARLGETVVLPPFLEPYRRQIVKNLKPIDRLMER